MSAYSGQVVINKGEKCFGVKGEKVRWEEAMSANVFDCWYPYHSVECSPKRDTSCTLSYPWVPLSILYET